MMSSTAALATTINGQGGMADAGDVIGVDVEIIDHTFSHPDGLFDI